MTEIRIAGEIVGKLYDCAFFNEWIEKGIICPASRPVAAFDALNEGDEATVFVNSPGGDCFAGSEIVIAARKACTRGAKVTVEVGAEACSMGAAFVTAMKASGASVTAHSNTQFMFHGAFTEAEGGAQALEDRAELVRNFNESVMDDLAKLGITDCRAWFAEGREKWISGADALDLGLVDIIAEDESAKVDGLDAVKMRMAAFADVESRVESRAQQLAEEMATALANERFAKLQAKHDAEFQNLKDTAAKMERDLAEVKAKAEADATSHAAIVEQLNADLAHLGDQLREEKEAHEAVVADALAPVHVPTLEEGLKACRTPAERSAFIAKGNYRKLNK